ncbi:MAG: dihydrodipicolinate synthase family protein [Planctomycetia bacterium]|nr:dihydrodipicolinate synthase family protein [Planctomycetia bacterium]
MLKLQGIIPPMITPLTDQDRLDLASLESLLEYMIDGGIHGVFLLGTTGEAPSLTHELRKQLIDAATKIIAGRIPVLVGISDTSFTETIQLAKTAEKYPVDAFVLTHPYYFPSYGPQFRQYVDHVLDAVSLPVILYNMPENTKVKFDLDLVRYALDRDGIIGMKDSSGDLDFFWRSCELAAASGKEFPILMGPEHLLGTSIRLGGSGGVSGGANLWPSLFVRMFEAAKGNDLAKMRDLQKKIDLLGKIYRVAENGGRVFRGLKCALKYRALCSGITAQPFTEPDPAEQKRIFQIVDELNPVKL